jgi:hypothetical protein
MRKNVHNAVIAARDLLDKMMTNVVLDSTLTEDELLSRNVNEHKRSPQSLRSFVRENAPPGSDIAKEEERYRSTMEHKLKKRMK